MNKDIKEADDYHLLGWVFGFFFPDIRAPLTFGWHTWLDSVVIPGALFGPAKFSKSEHP